jgi:hypothetical protein
MKDRYLFRGQRVDNGEFITGSLIQNDQNQSYIVEKNECFIGFLSLGDEDVFHDVYPQSVVLLP